MNEQMNSHQSNLLEGPPNKEMGADGAEGAPRLISSPLADSEALFVLHL